MQKRVGAYWTLRKIQDPAWVADGVGSRMYYQVMEKKERLRIASVNDGISSCVSPPGQFALALEAQQKAEAPYLLVHRITVYSGILLLVSVVCETSTSRRMQHENGRRSACLHLH